MFQWIRGILMWLGVLKVPVVETYFAFMSGRTRADMVYKYLRLDQIEEFIRLHEKVKSFVDGQVVGLPDDVTLGLVQIMTENPRRFHFSLAQLDALIERDLEKQILRKQKKNVVSRES